MSAYVNRPSTYETRKFSVELETDSCEGWEQCQAETGFSAHYDGSIGGKEFKGSKLSGNDGIAQCVAFAHYANRKGWQVDSRCGYHVHLDARTEEIGHLVRICKAYKGTEKTWLKMVRIARLRGIYTKKINWASDAMPTDSADSFYSWANSQNRYQWFNVNAYAKHGTLEIRLHPGTLDANKIAYWAIAHLEFVAWARTASYSEIDRVSAMGELDQLDFICSLCEPAARDYLRQRFARKCGAR